MKEIVLAINFQPETLKECIDALEAEHKVKISCSYEREPLGTAGAIRLAKELLEVDGQQHFFVLNSHVVGDFPLKEMVAFH